MQQYYLSVCAIFRDESAYLDEWINFHRMMGVDHFYLYDNESEDESRAVLSPYIDQGLVTLKPWPIPFAQQAARKAYADCLENVRQQTRWLACIDIDEFLFSPEIKDLKKLLREYEPFPGVIAYWQVYGSSHHQYSSPEPVISRFTHRAPRQWIRNHRFKTIANTSKALKPGGCHHFIYQNGEQAVNENMKPVSLKESFKFKRKLRPFFKYLGPLINHIDPYAMNHICNSHVTVSRLRINHYAVKSFQEYCDKSRYKKDKKRYDYVNYFSYHDRNEIEDPILHTFLPDIKSISNTAP